MHWPSKYKNKPRTKIQHGAKIRVTILNRQFRAHKVNNIVLGENTKLRLFLALGDAHQR